MVVEGKRQAIVLSPRVRQEREKIIELISELCNSTAGCTRVNQNHNVIAAVLGLLQPGGFSPPHPPPPSPGKKPRS